MFEKNKKKACPKRKQKSMSKEKGEPELFVYPKTHNTLSHSATLDWPLKGNCENLLILPMYRRT